MPAHMHIGVHEKALCLCPQMPSRKVSYAGEVEGSFAPGQLVEECILAIGLLVPKWLTDEPCPSGSSSCDAGGVLAIEKLFLP